ncbi:MAG: hypothetical protein ACJATK_002414 [Paracoccaceae bacterium]|jgi:hypothetical protein
MTNATRKSVLLATHLMSGLQGLINVQTLVGHDYYDDTIARLGLRHEL